MCDLIRTLSTSSLTSENTICTTLPYTSFGLNYLYITKNLYSNENTLIEYVWSYENECNKICSNKDV